MKNTVCMSSGGLPICSRTDSTNKKFIKPAYSLHQSILSSITLDIIFKVTLGCLSLT